MLLLSPILPQLAADFSLLLTTQHWRLFPNHFPHQTPCPSLLVNTCSSTLLSTTQSEPVNGHAVYSDGWILAYNSLCVGWPVQSTDSAGLWIHPFFSLAAFGGSPVHTACPFFLFSSLSSLFFQLTRDFTFKQPAQVNILSLSLENNHSSNHNYKWVSRLLPPILSLSLFPLCRYSRTQQCTTIYPIVEMANNWLTLNLVIAAQRRGRNGYGSRKRQRQVIPQPQPSQSTSEEESTDGGSVTRCVCGESRKCE